MYSGITKGSFEEAKAGINEPIVVFQTSCPQYPVTKWKIMHVYSPSVTPNWPTLVLRIPVWCYIQFAAHNEDCDA